MMLKQIMLEVGNRIREARKKKDLTQTELGMEIGYSMNGIAKIERGESDPKLSSLLKIAAALDLDIDYVVGSDKSEFIKALQSVIINQVQRAEAAEKALKEGRE